MYLLIASAAAASLVADVRAGKTYIELQPGTHTFSGANVSGSLTIVGASAGGLQWSAQARLQSWARLLCII